MDLNPIPGISTTGWNWDIKFVFLTALCLTLSCTTPKPMPSDNDILYELFGGTRPMPANRTFVPWTFEQLREGNAGFDAPYGVVIHTQDNRGLEFKKYGRIEMQYDTNTSTLHFIYAGKTFHVEEVNPTSVAYVSIGYEGETRDTPRGVHFVGHPYNSGG